MCPLAKLLRLRARITWFVVTLLDTHIMSLLVSRYLPTDVTLRFCGFVVGMYSKGFVEIWWFLRPLKQNRFCISLSPHSQRQKHLLEL